MEYGKKERNISDVKNFCMSNLDIIKNIAIDVYEKVRQNRGLLDIPQLENNKSVAGNYEIYINDFPLYAGESGNVYVRACEHIYNMYNGYKFGFQLPKKGISITIKITHLGITEKGEREQIEADAIAERKHILQFTDPNASEYPNEYPNDKKQYIQGEEVPREKIRPDYCIVQNLRKARINELLKRRSGENNN
jgi:hypothetical protein